MAHDIQILRELVVLAGVSLAVVLVFQRLRIPAIIGFMATGVLIGPGGLGLVQDTVLIRTLAEFGVVLLLFAVGLEFSLADLRRLGRTALIGGALQIVLAIVVVAAALIPFGIHPARAVFFGMLVSLSSTAVVLKLLTDRLELGTPHGRLATGVLIAQDLAAILFLLAVPVLGGWLRGGLTRGPGLPGVLGTLAGIVMVALGLAAAQRAIPWVMGRASRTGSREAFLLGVILVALGAAYLAARAGGSLAIGAFLAGLMLAGSDLRSQIAADVLPFRDVLGSVFFVAIGMSLDTRLLVTEPGIVIASTAGLVGVKFATAFAALRLARASWRVASGAAFALAQTGEFSFVLAQSGGPHGLLGALGQQAFTSGAVFSLVLTPLLVARAPRWALAIELRRPWRRGVPVDVPATPDEAPQSALMADHVVVAGAGHNGQNVARVLRAVRLPHVVVDLDPDSLQAIHREGSRGMVGDIANPMVQRQAGVARARVLVLALSDPTATRHAVRVARGLSRGVFIVVRTRYVSEIDELYGLGANQVIPEEFETSIEIFTSVLREFHIPNNIIQAQIFLLRQERYSILRGRRLPAPVVEQLDTILEAGTTDTFLILQQSPALGASLGQLGLAGDAPRVVAVVRGGQALTGLGADFTLRVGDTLVLTGTHAQIEQAFRHLS